MNEDRKWLEEHAFRDENLFFYGALYDELETVSTEEFWKKLRDIAGHYLSLGASATETYHQIIDDMLKSLVERDVRYGYPAPYCHKGCCRCCHELVYCTANEAKLIYGYCQDKSIEIDYQKLARQLNYIEVDDQNNHTGVTTWNEQPEKDQSCIFLDPGSGACRIWEVRPFVCRVHLAEATDEYCRPYNGVPNPKAMAISYPEWSYVLTAIFSIHKDSILKSMGRLLIGQSFEVSGNK